MMNSTLDQTDRDFTAMWCDCCGHDVTHLLSRAMVADWRPSDDWQIRCPACRELAVHQTSFNV